MTAQELITMGVKEKEEYLLKLKRFKRRRHTESGITAGVKQILLKRGLIPEDLKYLPACEVKDIL